MKERVESRRKSSQIKSCRIDVMKTKKRDQRKNRVVYAEVVIDRKDPNTGTCRFLPGRSMSDLSKDRSRDVARADDLVANPSC